VFFIGLVKFIAMSAKTEALWCSFSRRHHLTYQPTLSLHSSWQLWRNG